MHCKERVEGFWWIESWEEEKGREEPEREREREKERVEGVN